MSLSPLYPNLTNDLHVSSATSLQQGFPRLRPIQEKITIFRVPSHMLHLTTFSDRSGAGLSASHYHKGFRESKVVSFNAPSRKDVVSITTRLAGTIDSLVRVSRRVNDSHSNQDLTGDRNHSRTDHITGQAHPRKDLRCLSYMACRC
jgi:hypothetical protein